MTYQLSKHFLIGIFLLLVFLLPQIILASDPPKLISPSDNSVENKSPKLTWEYNGECFQDGSCFRVEVDNNSDFSSVEKSTYDKDTSYSPQGLAEGIWNWRVKAKDKSEKWSDWSTAFKFTIQPGSAESSSPPAAISDSKKSETSFNFKDNPSEINSDQEFEMSVSLKIPDKPTTDFYLKGAFKKDNSSNYFGQTYSSDWTNNGEKYSQQLKITTNASGEWDGKIKIKPDSEDSGFDGTGDYIFKVARYSDSGSGPTWSNDTKIKINEIKKPEPSVEKIAEDIQEEEIELAAIPEESSPSYEIKIASVAGVTEIRDNTPLPEQPRVLGEKQINWFLIILGVGILISGGGFVFFKFHPIRHSRAGGNP